MKVKKAIEILKSMNPSSDLLIETKGGLYFYSIRDIKEQELLPELEQCIDDKQVNRKTKRTVITSKE